MKEYVRSKTTGKVYCPSDAIRIVNIRQVAQYMRKNIEILDFYVSKDLKTEEDILVFLVNKKESQKAYQEWLESRNG